MSDLFCLQPGDLDRLAGCRVVLSMSGGKDSNACALLLERHGISFDAVFMDTGWEHPQTYAYIEDVLAPRFGAPIVLTNERYPGGMVDLVRSKGSFPRRTMRFCTEELKFAPFKAFVDGLEGPVVNVVGIRHAESAVRASALRWEDDEALGVTVWRPLIAHTFEDVIAMHREADLMPNPLYLAGATRVGCFPCIFARKAEVEAVAKMWPERIEQIEALEAELSSWVVERRDADWESMAEAVRSAMNRLAYREARARVDTIRWDAWQRDKLTPPQAAARRVAVALVESGTMNDAIVTEVHRQSQRTFFHGRTGNAQSGIREVVEWAMTDRGGVQFRLFDLTARDGCMRWGLCDTAPEVDLAVRKAEDDRG